MGLIKAIAGAAGGVMADQWKEYFYCEAIDAEVLVTKGQKKVSKRSSNTKGSDNIITSGSVIAVADGQCMLIVEQGKIVEVSAEPGEFIFDSSTEPSIFAGGLNLDNLKTVFATVGKRFTFGGEPAKDQRVYYVNTKEIYGNKYGTAAPIPFDVVDRNVGMTLTISLRCFGEYSYKVVNPLSFYCNVCGNVSGDFTRDKIESQLRTELLTALQPAFAKLSAQGVRYSELIAHTTEIANALNAELSEKWTKRRGIEIVEFGVSSATASAEDEKMIKEMQKSAALRDPSLAGGLVAGATASAMQSAASNPNGAAMAFMGMGMAQNSGGNAMQGLYQQAAAQQAVAPSPAAQAKPAAVWICPSCGKEANGKFCTECGTKKPEVSSWICPSCGKENSGKFCQECGTKKPEKAASYKCNKCGWVPEDPANPPKFCPECGDPINADDQV